MKKYLLPLLLCLCCLFPCLALAAEADATVPGADIAATIISWLPESWSDPADQRHHFDIAWEWVPPSQRHGREAFYTRFLPFRGGKKHQPQDSYSLRCIPQVHGAVRDALEQARRVIDIELNAVTDNPLVFPDTPGARQIEDQVISAPDSKVTVAVIGTDEELLIAADTEKLVKGETV